MTNNQLDAYQFEEFSQGDNTVTWWGSDFMVMLGYSTLQSFTNPIRRAIQSCLTAGIDTHGDIDRVDRVVNGDTIPDFKLSRFGCYMIAMNSDIKKPQVAAAQVYFAKTTEQINCALEGSLDVDRLNARSEITESNKQLSAAAKRVGVSDFGRFHDAGYRGMYNMGLKQLCRYKGVPKDLYDYMGRAELAANLFRITMTEEKLKTRNVTNGFIANQVHQDVGASVRKIVKESTGRFPENIPLERKLTDVKKELKKANKQLKKG